MASATQRPRTGWTARIPAVIVMLVGVVLIGTTLMNNLFKVGPAFETLTDGFRPVLTAQAIETARTDVAALGAVGEEFQTAVTPAMAERFGMTPERSSSAIRRSSSRRMWDNSSPASPTGWPPCRRSCRRSPD